MKKSEYLSKVNGFIDYILAISQTLKHSYRDKSSKKKWRTNGLLNAAGEYRKNEDDMYSGYRWKFNCIVPVFDDGNEFERCKGETLQGSADALSKLQKYLEKQLANKNDLGAFLACKSVLKWGGVWSNGNDLRLYNHAKGLADTLNLLNEKLKEHQSNDADDEELARVIKEKFWMNAGSTKIFSLLLPDFCIYDGRVGAALGMLARNYCRANKINGSEFPKELAFPWGLDKGNGRGNRSRRDPSDDRYRFPRLTNDTFSHALWNIRANWLIQALANKLKVTSEDKIDALRRLEAALFMIGYDVRDGVSESVNGANTKKASRQSKTSERTARKPPSDTKKEKAKRIYSENLGRPRNEIIEKFIDKCGLTRAGASTYYQNIKRESGDQR